MSIPVLDRYLAREALRSWFVVTVVLLLIMLANRFAHYLRYAASGDLPGNILGWLVGLSTIRYLVYLLPASYLLAIMLALGRLYRDIEMAAIAACGIGLHRLYRPFVVLGVLLSIITAVLSLGFSPWAARKAEMIYQKGKQEVKLSLLAPGGFQNLPNDRGVLYAGDSDTKTGDLRNIFVYLANEGDPVVITAARGVQRTDPDSGDRSVVLLDGYRVEGAPGQAVYRIMRFREHGARIAPPALGYNENDQSGRPTSALLGSSDPKDQAELQWRISAPISILVLTLIALPLAYVSPRQGRYAKLLLGLLIYVIYANLLGLAQTWAGEGSLPIALGLWWVHAIFLLLAMCLIARRQGGFSAFWHRFRATP